MNPKRVTASIVLLAFVSGCSTASKDITPAAISPAIYSNYDCEQVRLELLRVSTEVNSMTGKLDKNRENDNMATTAGIILFFPVLFFLGGTKEQEARYAQLKGEHSALEQTSIIKRCSLKNADSK
jgi:hypothetical protein